MKSRYVVCLCFFTVVLYQSPAVACRLMEHPSVESLQNAPVALIGTVIEAGKEGRVGMTVDGRLTFAVQKVIRGVPEDAETFSVDIQGATSCDTEFRLGERWLYLGYHIRNNSLMLERQVGVSVSEHIEFVKEQTGFDEAAQSRAHKGTYAPICKEGKESGFEIKLENGMAVVVFSVISDVLPRRTVFENDRYKGDPLAQFVATLGASSLDTSVQLDRQNMAGRGKLDICDQGGKCTPLTGARLHIGEIVDGRVTGKIMWYENPPAERVYTFRVERDPVKECH